MNSLAELALDGRNPTSAMAEIMLHGDMLAALYDLNTEQSRASGSPLELRPRGHQHGPPEAVEQQHRQHERRHHGQHERCRGICLSCKAAFCCKTARAGHDVGMHSHIVDMPSLSAPRSHSTCKVPTNSVRRQNAIIQCGSQPADLRQRRAGELLAGGNDPFHEAVSAVEQHGGYPAPILKHPLPPGRPARELCIATHSGD